MSASDFDVTATGGVHDVLDEVERAAGTPNFYNSTSRTELAKDARKRSLRTMLAVVCLGDKDGELEDEEEIIRMINAQNEMMRFVTFQVLDCDMKKGLQYAWNTFGIAGICGDGTSGKTIRLMFAMDID